MQQSEILNIKTPASFNNLSFYKKERLLEIIDELYNSEFVSGVLWGGSLSYKKDLPKADVDLFCLVDNMIEVENIIKDKWADFKEIDQIIYQGYFEWTGRLYTLYYKRDLDFSIDICLISADKASKFFWEPDGFILFDRLEAITKYRTIQLNNPNFTKQPFLKSNPFSLSIVTLKKIEKNLYRDHLWNALEQLSILRRYVMQIIRLEIIKDANFLGRVDRDFEDVTPQNINKKLAETTASYSSRDIALKTVLLIDIIESLKKELLNGNEKEFEEWILRQLQYQREQLHKYTD